MPARKAQILFLVGRLWVQMTHGLEALKQTFYFGFILRPE